MLTRAWRPTLALTAGLALLTSGCGAPEEPTAVPAAAAPAASAPSAPAGSDLVAAVSAARGDTPVGLRFALGSRPAVGQPVDVQLELLPTVKLDRLIVTFHGGEALELQRGADPLRLERPAPGEPVSHVLTVVPRRDGIYTLNVAVHSESPALSLSRSYSIPVIAGAGVQPAPGAAAR